MSGSLTATNIYTKTEIANLLTPTATFVYVDGQLLLEANQSTTYTKTEVDTMAVAKLDASALVVAITPNRTLIQH